MIRRLATVLLLVIATSMLLAAENAKKPKNEFTTLADFTGSANGAVPLYGGLIEGTDGNFYGTTYGGGVYDEGTVFEATPDGTLTILYSFCSQTSCTDGTNPSSTAGAIRRELLRHNRIWREQRRGHNLRRGHSL
jgi:uncharacterized repeat protein (TIGR03803 family)